MAELVLTRGIPGSGKTTWAKAWLAEDPENRARVSRDDLREQLFGQTGRLEHPQEKLISKAERAIALELLESGRSVVIDSTHIRVRYVRSWQEVAHDVGAEFRVQEFDTPVQECIVRNAWRERRVPEDVILDMHKRLASARRSEAQAVATRAREEAYTYVPDESLEPCWIFDIDGTLARHVGRSPYEYDRVSEDEPIQQVVRLLRSVAGDETAIVVVSGREDSCREATEAWLAEHVGQPYCDELHMRPTGDRRDDARVKLEILRDVIAPRYHVLGVFDDRNRVVRMWRDVGLLCAQVAPGAF